HVRNKVIARVFRELNLMEEWGTGYKRVSEACQADGYQTPVWEELGPAMRVIFRPHFATQEKIESMPRKKMNELTLRQQKILNFLHKKEPLSAKKIHNEFSEKISE